MAGAGFVGLVIFRTTPEHTLVDLVLYVGLPVLLALFFDRCAAAARAHVDRDVPLDPSRWPEVQRRASRRWREQTMNFALYLGVAALFPLLWWGFDALLALTPIPASLHRAGAFAVGLLVTAASMSALHRYRFGPVVRQVLNEFGCPVCVRCGFSLVGAVDGRCPECGDTRSPGVDP